ncbi:hypothetical protein CBS101457_000790 [Exobasidium rhododendri]|nr:hypothetical protein CBS101457_000790 [Exobasidium rhododendri]
MPPVLLAARSSTRLLILQSAPESKRVCSLLPSSEVDSFPSTACPLSHFFPTAESPITGEYKARLRSAASLMGELHAHPDLSDAHQRFLKCENCDGAHGRYTQLTDTNIQEHQNWLTGQGVGLDIIKVHERSENLTSVVTSRKYKSFWIVCVANLYPDAIWVDELDPSKVYCLAEEGRESPLELTDRLYPLARLAFTSKLPREDIADVLFTPYTSAFEGKKDGNERAIFQERFWLILHAIHLDYFLYWTKMRNPSACRRIQDRLLEEDAYFDPSFFGQEKFKKFELHSSSA